MSWGWLFCSYYFLFGVLDVFFQLVMFQVYLKVVQDVVSLFVFYFGYQMYFFSWCVGLFKGSVVCNQFIFIKFGSFVFNWGKELYCILMQVYNLYDRKFDLNICRGF